MTILQQAPTVRKLRCSSLDGLFACTPSVLSDDPSYVRINPLNEAADMGNAVHQLAANMIEGKPVDIREVSDFYEMDEEEVTGVYGYAERAWIELEKFFENPQVETLVQSAVLDVAGQQFQITGTCDVVSPIGSTNAIFLDWKTGYLDDSYHQQMIGYAYCIWCEMGKPEECTITGIVAFLRHRYYRVVKFDATRLKAWEYDLTHNVLPAINTFRPGKTCRYCELYASCSARNAMVGSSIQTLMFPSKANASNLTNAVSMLAKVGPATRDDPAVGELLNQLTVNLKLAEQQIDNTKEMIRMAVQRAGYVTMPGELAMMVRSLEIDKIVPPKAIKVLRTLVSERDILDAMSLSLPKLLAAKRKGAAKGQKGVAADQLKDELRKAGAIKTNIQERLEMIDLSQAQEEQKEKEDASRSTHP